MPVALTPDAGAPGHVFISYVREDKAVVDLLQEILRSRPESRSGETQRICGPARTGGWRSCRAITGGSFAFLACFSDNSAARQTTYQNEELIVAVEQMRQMPPGRPWLLPIRLADCDMPEFDLGAGRTLASLHRVDLFDDLWQTGTARLVAAVVRCSASPCRPCVRMSETSPSANRSSKLLREPHRQIELEDLVAENRHVRARADPGHRALPADLRAPYRRLGVLLLASMNEGPLSTPVLRRDGAWLREVVARRHGRRRSSGRMWGAGGRYGPRVGWWWCGAVPMSLSLHQLRGPGVIGARSGGACQKRTVKQSGEKWRLPERRA